MWGADDTNHNPTSANRRKQKQAHFFSLHSLVRLRCFDFISLCFKYRFILLGSRLGSGDVGGGGGEGGTQFKAKTQHMFVADLQFCEF